MSSLLSIHWELCKYDLLFLPSLKQINALSFETIPSLIAYLWRPKRQERSKGHNRVHPLFPMFKGIGLKCQTIFQKLSCLWAPVGRSNACFILHLSVAQKESQIGVPFFNETGYQSVHKICGPFTVKTRLDKNEEYDPPAMNEGVVNANLKLGGEGGREKWNSCMWEKTVRSAPVFPCSPPPLCTVLLLTFDFIPSSGKYVSH